mmetsp:Transcript_8166/g.16378  ORF Transcript_8166/g.16378 Transcript_8166/m.16378 type:complete len:250 (-) Transcript_8166:210-959(-)
MVPRRSKSGFMKSLVPMDTPPVVMIMSAPKDMASSRAFSIFSSVSRAIPISKARAPEAETAETSMALLASRTFPLGKLSIVGSSTSSPVDIIATVGFLYTGTSLTPTVASIAISPAPMYSPFCITTSPGRISEPTSLISSPDFTSRSISTILSSPSTASVIFVSSICTTASAPSGTGPPVPIYATCPELSTAFASPPACASNTTGYLPGPSLATTAYPSLMDARNAGTGSTATTSSPITCPCAASKLTD